MTITSEPNGIIEPSETYQTPSMNQEPSKQNSTTTIEPLPQNPIENFEPSKQNQIETSKDNTTLAITESTETDRPKSFSFEVRPASKLKEALAPLCDEEFNSNGCAMIRVSKIGMEITVQNGESLVAGHLWLKATGLINFEFNKDLNKHLVYLIGIFNNLVDASHQSSVTIYHFDGSEELFFSFGDEAGSCKQLAVEIKELDSVNRDFPKITYACEAVILSDQFRDMVETYKTASSKHTTLVSVVFSEANLKVSIGGTNDWSFDYSFHDKVKGISGMQRGQTHHAWFQLPHCEFLRKASLLVPGVLLCLVTNLPPQCILLRFNLRELGDLVYLKTANKIFFNSDRG